MIPQTFAKMAVFANWQFLQINVNHKLSSPLHKIALLRPKASAVDELMCSTIRCFIFFMTAFKGQHVHDCIFTLVRKVKVKSVYETRGPLEPKLISVSVA